MGQCANPTQIVLFNLIKVCMMMVIIISYFSNCLFNGTFTWVVYRSKILNPTIISLSGSVALHTPGGEGVRKSVNPTEIDLLVFAYLRTTASLNPLFPDEN